MRSMLKGAAAGRTAPVARMLMALLSVPAAVALLPLKAATAGTYQQLPHPSNGVGAPRRSTLNALPELVVDDNGTALISTGAELVASFVDPRCQLAQLAEDYVRMSSEDWAPLEATGLPLLLAKNLTIRGRSRSDGLGMTELDLAFTKAKVYLAAYAVLAVENLTMFNWVSGTQFGPIPTVDLIAPSTRFAAGGSGDQPMGSFSFTGIAIVYSACPLDYFPGAEQQITAPVRPPYIPGYNQVDWITSQEGCVNSSAAPPLERCWLLKLHCLEAAAYATTPGPLGAPMLAGYIFRGLDSWMLCTGTKDNYCDGCLEGTGKASASSPTPQPSSSAVLPGLLAADAPASGGSTGSTNLGAVLGAVLGGVLGGVALAACAFMVYRRRRRRRAEQGSAGLKEKGLKEDLSSSRHTDTNAVAVIVSSEPAAAAEPAPAAAPTAKSKPAQGSKADTFVPVTPVTPMAEDVRLDVRVGLEVQLTEHVLGKGAYGRVVRGVYTGVEVAVKLVDRGLLSPLPRAKRAETPASGTPSSCTKTESTRTPEQLALLTEVEVLARCQHPNVIRVLAANVDPKQLCLVMELMDTSLDRFLHSSLDLLPLPLVLHIGTEVATALAYLHPTIMHRDLKPANILLSNVGSERPVVKLADFGISRLLDTVLCTRNPEVGTAPYMAPELFDLTNVCVTDKVDIYALAVVLWQLLTRQLPWSDMQGVVAVAYAVSVNGQRPPMTGEGIKRCPRKLVWLIQAMWDQDPARRPAAAEVVKVLALCREQLEMGERNSSQ